MTTKIALAAFAAATLMVGPVLADEAAATTTTTTTTEATPATAATPAVTTTETSVSEGKEFGNPGVINIAAATSLGASFSSSKPPGGGDSGSGSHFSIVPSIDYFVAEGISIGALLLVDIQSQKVPPATDSSKQTTIGIGPRLGYNLWLTPGKLSLWPQVGFLYSSTSTSAGGKDGPSLSRGTLDVFVPLLIHPVKHFHFAIGPFVDLDVMSKASLAGQSADGEKTTTFGLRAEIAGWL